MTNRHGLKDKVRYNLTGQTLTFEAPEGRPTANGEVRIYDPRYSMEDTTKNPVAMTASSVTATRSSATATVGAAGAAAAQKTIACTPHADWKVGDWVWVTAAASGRKTRVQIAQKQSGAIVTADDLPFALVQADTIESALLTSPTFTSAFITDEQNIAEDYFVEWIYAVAGITYYARRFFDVVREIINFDITDEWLLERHPGLMRLEYKRQPGTFEPQRRAAQRNVERHIIGVGKDPDRYRGTEIMRELVGLQVVCVLAWDGNKPNGVPWRDYATHAEEEYSSAFEQLTGNTLRVPYDRNHDDALTSAERNECVVDLLR